MSSVIHILKVAYELRTNFIWFKLQKWLLSFLNNGSNILLKLRLLIIKLQYLEKKTSLFC